jgi:hypothetical protein
MEQSLAFSLIPKACFNHLAHKLARIDYRNTRLAIKMFGIVAAEQSRRTAPRHNHRGILRQNRFSLKQEVCGDDGPSGIRIRRHGR